MCASAATARAGTIAGRGEGRAQPRSKRMHMTLEADYAVRIVEHLTENACRCDAKSISEQTEIPLRFSLKILRKLVTDGLVCSYKGAKGGYTLAKPPWEITLKQVIESVEGPYILSRCQKEEYSCGRAHCRLHTIYEKISDGVRRELDAYDFETICAPDGDCGCGCEGRNQD